MKDAQLRSKAKTTEFLTLVGFAAATFTIIVATFHWTTGPDEAQAPAKISSTPPSSAKTLVPAPIPAMIPQGTSDSAPKSVDASTAAIDRSSFSDDARRTKPSEPASKPSISDSQTPEKTPAEPGKAQPTEFTCEAKSASEVLLKGAFLVRTRGIQPMFQEEEGLWRTTVMLLPGNYQYFCIIDGVPSETRSIRVTPAQ